MAGLQQVPLGIRSEQLPIHRFWRDLNLGWDLCAGNVEHHRDDCRRHSRGPGVLCRLVWLAFVKPFRRLGGDR